MLNKMAALGGALATLLVGMGYAVSGDSKTCHEDDQLPCLCKDAGYTSKDPENKACFLGDVNFTTKSQIDPLSAHAFVALSWPVKTDASGKALVGQADLKAKRSGDWTPVWATWKSTRDIFRQPQAPVPWAKLPDTAPAACKALDHKAEKAKFPYAHLVPDETPPRVLEEYLNPHKYLLIDADGVPVRYDISMNRQAVEYITNNNLWNSAGLSSYIAANKKLDLPVGKWDRGPSNPPERGAIALKSAWKVLTPKDDPSRFHKEWGYITPVIDGGKKLAACQLKPIGLIALHIVYKTDQMKEWSWGTFEHRDAAPTWNEIGATSAGFYPNGDAVPDWLFYKNDAKGAATINKPERDPLSTTPARIVKPYQPGYYFGPVSTGGQKPCGPTNQEFRCINVDMANTLSGSVFANYELVGTQWRQTTSGQVGLLLPEVLGNVAMETFSQAKASCLTCHSFAGPSGSQGKGVYDFLFSFQLDVATQTTTETGEMAPKN